MIDFLIELKGKQTKTKVIDFLIELKGKQTIKVIWLFELFWRNK